MSKENVAVTRRAGKTVRFQSYTDVDQALEDAGIGD
jgi:hypothetical protein